MSGRKLSENDQRDKGLLFLISEKLNILSIIFVLTVHYITVIPCKKFVAS